MSEVLAGERGGVNRVVVFNNKVQRVVPEGLGKICHLRVVGTVRGVPAEVLHRVIRFALISPVVERVEMGIKIDGGEVRDIFQVVSCVVPGDILPFTDIGNRHIHISHGGLPHVGEIEPDAWQIAIHDHGQRGENFRDGDIRPGGVKGHLF